ncbi:MAG: DUF6252 family protein [Leadbetterella sp.]
MKCLIFLLIIFFYSCSKLGIGPSNYFNAKLDGKSYKCSGVYAYATSFTDSHAIYGVADENKTGRAIYISIQKTDGVGNYQLNDGKRFALFKDEKGIGYRSDFVGGSGELKITKISSTVAEGTFKCVVKEKSDGSGKSVTFTEGEFSVAFR